MNKCQGKSPEKKYGSVTRFPQFIKQRKFNKTLHGRSISNQTNKVSCSNLLRPETKTEVDCIDLHGSPELVIFQHQNRAAAGTGGFIAALWINLGPNNITTWVLWKHMATGNMARMTELVLILFVQL